MILACYDGSADSQAAIDHTAGLIVVPRRRCHDLGAVSRRDDPQRRDGYGHGHGTAAPFADDEQIGATIQQTALRKAGDGAQRAMAHEPARSRAQNITTKSRLHGLRATRPTW